MDQSIVGKKDIVRAYVVRQILLENALSVGAANVTVSSGAKYQSM